MIFSTIVSLLAVLLLAQPQPQSQTPPQFPSREGKIDIRAGFANPPAGYGNVPFYWWSGDTLRIDRLAEQLDLLADSPTEGFAISYNHTDAKVDIELNADGHGPCGVADYGRPHAFSPEWWKIWNTFSAMCAERGMGVGMDDYVFAWPNNKDFMDRVRNNGLTDRYQGRLKCVTIARTEALPENCLMSEPRGKDSLTVVYSVPSPELHPALGQLMIDEYFQPFEDHMDAKGRAGMNYFFQDELMYHPGIDSWCEDMPEQFLSRKGYDVIPHLPALFEDRGEESVKTRLDYAEVVMDLAEERFFKPIYDWHSSRNLIYGCDNNGRGLEPLEYLDYFRAISWFSAPGNDAPARGSSFMQTKVSSSVAHLYDRPRTWLEAFHSMGWDANGAVLTHQLDHHIIAGGNLLCMHGLYYSTRGGWWEWAPPSFHFRMPYWEHMKLWLKYAQRLCFVLSQGRHVCDVAILYPTETMQAIPGSNPDLMFDAADSLSTHGVDFDFIDYRSLQKASKDGGVLSVAGENYRVLVLADIQAVHPETAQAIEAFKQAGGIVLALGKCLDGMQPLPLSELVAKVETSFVPDFKSGSGAGRVLHHRVADRDVYMVMDVEKGDEMFFRSHGRVEKWDAMSGKISEIGAISCDAEGTKVRFEGETGSSMLVVFSPGEPRLASTDGRRITSAEVIPLDGDWDLQIVPTMNNKWGDYRLPASDEFIGVEARSMQCGADGKEYGEAVYDNGPYMLVSGDGLNWEPYIWSWRSGVPDSPGSQGYHGLKGKVDSRFLILDRGGEMYFKTRVFAPENGVYRIVKEGVEPEYIRIDGIRVQKPVMRLKQGWHELRLRYTETKPSTYSLEGMRAYTRDSRDRSMVMLYPVKSAGPVERDLYSEDIASKWYGTDFLPFNPLGGENQIWNYSFDTAPGSRSMSLDVRGEILEIKVDGIVVQTPTDIPFNPGISHVEISARPDESAPGAAFFSTPVKLDCKGGRMPAGDWTQAGALKYYSGCIRYSKTVKVDSPAGTWTLDLGDVDATCEVIVNGKSAGALLSIPYRADLSGLLHKGDNKMEVVVYSSLSNHYQTIPSPYRGKARAGLLGPVALIHTSTQPAP